MLFGWKSPPRFRVVATIGATTVVFLWRRDCNNLMAAATPIFTNVLPPGCQGKGDKQEPSGTGEESTVQGTEEVATQAPHPEHLDSEMRAR